MINSGLDMTALMLWEALLKNWFYKIVFVAQLINKRLHRLSGLLSM